MPIIEVEVTFDGRFWTSVVGPRLPRAVHIGDVIMVNGGWRIIYQATLIGIGRYRFSLNERHRPRDMRSHPDIIIVDQGDWLLVRDLKEMR